MAKPMQSLPDDEFLEQLSSQTFDDTLARIVEKIEGAGLTIFARIDHAAAARDVGLDMPPTIVLIYGNARGGTPIMLAAPQVALDLPLKVLVRADDGGDVFVGIHPIAGVLRRGGVASDVAARLEPAQAILFEDTAS